MNKTLFEAVGSAKYDRICSGKGRKYGFKSYQNNIGYRGNYCGRI